MLIVLLIVVLVLLLGGGGAYYGPRAGWRGPHYGGGSLGLVLLILLHPLAHWQPPRRPDDALSRRARSVSTRRLLLDHDALDVLVKGCAICAHRLDRACAARRAGANWKVRTPERARRGINVRAGQVARAPLRSKLPGAHIQQHVVEAEHVEGFFDDPDRPVLTSAAGHVLAGERRHADHRQVGCDTADDVQ